RGAGGAALALEHPRTVTFAPPPPASTDTASTTSSLLSSMNPNRDLWAASKADFIFSNVIAGAAEGGDPDSMTAARGLGLRASPLRASSATTENAGTTSAVSVPA